MTDNTMRTIILTEIETFLDNNDMAPSRFGYATMNDPVFVARLRDGADLKASTIDKLRKMMREYPKGWGNG